MTFNDMPIPAVAGASFAGEPVRSHGCIHSRRSLACCGLKCPLREHHLIYRVGRLAMKTRNERCSALVTLNLRHNGCDAG